MPLTDIVVLASIVLGTPALIWRLRRQGRRGARLARGGWVAFSGLALTVTMTMHSLDVLSRLYVGQGYDGTPWTYDFRVYSLLLLGALLASMGLRLLRVALRLPVEEPLGRTEALRVTLVVLALVAPLIPVQAFFAIPLTVIAVLNLLVVMTAGRTAPQAELEFVTERSRNRQLVLTRDSSLSPG